MTKTAERYKARGRCVWCGKPRQGISILCEECTRKRRARYLKRCAMNLCVQCGKQAQENKVLCFECAVKQSRYYKIRKEKEK